MVAVSWVGTADRGGDRQRPVHPRQPVGETGQTVTLGNRRSADPVVGDVDHRQSPDAAQLHWACRARLCFSTLAKASATTK